MKVSWVVVCGSVSFIWGLQSVMVSICWVDNLIQNHLGDTPQDMSVHNYLNNINCCARLISWEGIFPCQGSVDYVRWRQQDESQYSPVSSDFSCPGFPTIMDCTSNCEAEKTLLSLSHFPQGILSGQQGEKLRLRVCPQWLLCNFLQMALQRLLLWISLEFEYEASLTGLCVECLAP